jgi:hypothetical protein
LCCGVPFFTKTAKKSRVKREIESVMTRAFLKTTLAASAMCAAAAFSTAQAQEGVAVGLLTCGVKGGVSFIVGSTRELRCVYRTGPGDPGERYEGKIEKFGLDIGVTNNALMEWTVLAPTNRIAMGALAGRYLGVSADASVGVGGGANVLVGGSNNTISLQPVSVQAQTGLNAALAVASVELSPYYEGK